MSSSWKKAASSRLSSFKGYIAQQDFRNNLPEAITRQIGAGKERAGNFKEWAEQKINKGYLSQTSGTENVALFPGWAARRYPKVSQRTGQQEEPFSIEVYVSGFVSTHRSTESRSQRTFLRLAKGFAALPKLEGDPSSEILTESQPLSHSTEDLLKSIKLPPRPNEIAEDYEVELLEREFQNLNHSEDGDSSHSVTSSLRSNSSNSNSPTDTDPSSFVAAKNTASDELRKLHANLESRLYPFWSSVVPNRTVRLRLYTSLHHDDDPSVDNGPVSVRDVVTAPDGSFQALFTVEWKDLCNHPDALHIAFGPPSEEHELLVAAQLLPIPSPPSSAASSTADFSAYRRQPLENSRNQPTAPPTTLHVSITHSPVRVVSDIDDTVKFSNVTGGARAVFHNVFVKELKDLVIPGMGEWYSGMWKKGVRFHYVSNGPLELHPLIGEFFQISKLPVGSVKLRSYAGKSLFSGLLSAPSARKRAGVLEILDAFLDSKFLLVGDSGEQDLELYTELARERPTQVLAVFIRDTGSGEPLEDPTGDGFDKISLRSAPPTTRNSLDFSGELSRTGLTPLNSPYLTRTKKTPFSSGTKVDYFTSNPITAEPEALIDFDSPTTATPTMTTAPPSSATPSTPWSTHSNAPSFKSKRSSYSTNGAVRMTESERKRYELQMRLYRARAIIPFQITLRVFRSPSECIETWGLLDSYFTKK